MILKPIVDRFRTAVAAVLPSRRTFRGAAWGVAAGVATLLVLPSALGLRPASPNPGDLVAVAWLVALAVVAGGVVAGAAALLARVPWCYWWTVTTASLVLALLLLGLAPKTVVLVSAFLVGSWSLAGGGIAVALDRAGRGWRRRSLGGLAALAAALALAGALAWLRWDGPPEEPLPAVTSGSPPPTLELDDPSRPGPFTVGHLTYGSGKDLHRPEFGAKVDVRTRSMDVSPFLRGWTGAAGRARTRYWGFDATAVPLQAYVWYPQGNGRFPVALIVHGNYPMTQPSSSGYGYLGELLASRGFIAVSVDEEFLNNAASDLLAFPDLGLAQEGPARAVVVLEHLRLWREWAAAGAHPLAGKADLDRVALLGHSRGGEAVAVAAAFNRLTRFPDDARILFDYGFGIRAVVAIAAVDGLYRPGAIGTPLENVSYLALHGTHDGEVPTFLGARQYQRVAFTDGGDWFKAAVYVHRANHSQFNASWNTESLQERFLNVRPLLPRNQQEQIAKVFIAAFLEAALKGRSGYRALLQDSRAGAAWLPDVALVQQYEDARTRPLATYEEDLDVTSTTIRGGAIRAEGLTDWSERRINLKWDPLETRGVTLGWNRAGGAPAWYALTLPESLRVTGDSVLTFDLADAGRDPRSPRHESPGRGPAPTPSTADGGGPPAAADSGDGLDLTVELIAGGGATARLPLSSVSALRRQVRAEVAKAPVLTNIPRSEVVFQSFAFPLAAFAARNPAFDARSLRTVRWVFDRTAKGVVILDNVGLR